MKIGFVGLGKMGGNMVERLLNDNHEIVAYNLTEKEVKEAEQKGAIASTSIADLIEKLPEQKIVWLMIPAGKPVDGSIAELLKYLKAGDIIIDGGNSNWKDGQKRSQELKEKGIDFIDCGTSGGVWGLKNGYCLMYGGDKKACDTLNPVFATLAPPEGHIYCGVSGAGHFTKMIHNGIEYGMMQAYAEGFEIMEKSPFEIDLHGISKVWQQGSVVRSWLLELASNALEKDPTLSNIAAYVPDSGEGRWAVQAAIDLDVPAHVITASLYTRFASRQSDSFAMKLLSALRNQFGGHAVKDK